MDTRRRCIRSEAKRLQIFRKQEGKKTCYEVSFLFKGYGERAHKKALIVLPEVDSKVIKSANNIPGVKTAQVNTLNVYDILNADKLIIVKDAVSKIEEVYA